MDGAQKGQYYGTIANLDRLEEVQIVRGILVAHQDVVEELRLGRPFRVHVPAQVDRRNRGSKVRQCAGKAQLVGYRRDRLEGKCIYQPVLM